MESLTAEFTRFNHRGEARGRAGTGEVAAFGVLPGEKACVLPFRKKRKVLSCLPGRILTPAPGRVPPREDHYLSCSPWQVIAYESQVRFKSGILKKIFMEKAGEEMPPEAFFPSPDRWGYRTKMEFSFVLEAGRIMPAFNERGGIRRKIALPGGCALAGEKLNSAALSLTALFTELKMTGGELKTLTLRESKSTGKITAALAVKDEHFRPRGLQEPLPGLSGFTVFFSDPGSPSSVVSRVLCASGDGFIEESIGGMTFSYGIDGFFQNNVPQFERAVGIIAENMPRPRRIVELYSGSGAIGISLGHMADEVTGVELSPSGSMHANLNARRNSVRNFRTLEMPAEKAPREILESADVLILDPPRSGASPKVLARVMEAAPPFIAYLSCNPVSQAADYLRLKDSYRASGLWGFDFHPQTPHIESLLFLQRR